VSYICLSDADILFYLYLFSKPGLGEKVAVVRLVNIYSVAESGVPSSRAADFK